MRSCVVGAKWRAKYRADESDWDGYPQSYVVADAVSPEAADEAAQWLEAYRLLCAPLPDEDAMRVLTRLRMNCAKRPDEEHDWKVILSCWLDDVAQFPADVVLWAIEFWRRNEKFWPTWAEFLPLLERRTTQRLAAMQALATIIERGQAARRAAE